MDRAGMLFWIRWLRARFRFVTRRSPHPALLRGDVMRLDPAAIRRSITASEAFALPLGGREVSVTLSPAQVSDGEAQVVILDDDGGAEYAAPPDIDITFAGAVNGRDDSDVRLTVTERVVTGFVRLADEWYWIDPLRRFRADADPDQYLVYRSRDLVFRLPNPNDVLRGGEEPPEGDETDRAHRVNPHAGIVIWADRQFRDQATSAGLDWFQAQSALINNVNGIYEKQAGIEFRIRFWVLQAGSKLSSEKAETLLGQFGKLVVGLHGDIRALAVRKATGIEVAHLCTGKDLDGKTLGVAYQPGVWGLSMQWLYFSAGIITVGPSAFSYSNMMLAAHELGHNFTGDHDEAEKMCVAHFLWCWDYERTLMWPTVYSDNQARFSAANRKRVKDNAQLGRNVNYVHA